MGIRWTKKREVEVACELFAREGSGPYVPAEQDDLRRACEAVGLVVESERDEVMAQLRERITSLEADLAAALDRIAELEVERDLARGVNRRAAQTIIDCIGSVGPEDADAAGRIVSRIAELEDLWQAYEAASLPSHVRRERCLIARAVAGGVAVTVAPMPDAPWKWAVVVTAENHNLPGVGDVPWAEVPATLARLLGEVGA